MLFIILLIASTLAIAGSAAFFSIYGLAQIFTGSFWPVVIMASSLEAGKLVAASYVYRYWKKIGFLMKSYLITAIFILMMITSAGIFGFLSSAYQQDVLPLAEMESRIVLLGERRVELERLRQEEIVRRGELNSQVSDLPSNYATKREIVRKQIKPELDQIVATLQRYSQQITAATAEQHELKTKTIQQKVHTGPIIFIAEAFGQEIDDATKWMILLIIFAFDPLAVILTVGANIAILDLSKGKTKARVITEENMTDESSVDVIRLALEELQSKEVDLTPAEVAQKGMLEEMLRRKDITNNLRSGKEHTNHS